MSTALPPRPRFVGPKRSFGIVASSYNPEYVQALVDQTAKELGVLTPTSQVELHQVPGAYEIPVMVQELGVTGNFAAIIALGVIIRGSTDHADLIATSIFSSLQSIALRNRVPIINEVLLVDNEDLAKERCFGKKLNRGMEAARAAVEMADAMAPFKKEPEKVLGAGLR